MAPLAVFLWGAPASAYIDPGTGSALVYLVVGVVVSAFFAARSLWYRCVEFVASRGGLRHRKCGLVLHSEDPRYEIVFLPVIRALAARNVELTYVTMYPRAGGFEPLPPQATHRQIPPGLVGYAYLNNLEAAMLVTTTPQLDVMTFRRSRRVRHYCYIPHALGESLFLRPYAYDFFDSVLCCGPTVRCNIRRIEFIRKMPCKQLLETGLPHYDELAKTRIPADDAGGRRTVLVAPSWGPQSLFQRFGTAFVAEMARRHRVIVRPHPQMRVSQADLFGQVLALDGVEVDLAPAPADAMRRADILVSDISGIQHEFAFIHGKPVIVVEHDVDVGGLEGHLFGGVSTLRERCREFIIPLAAGEFETLPDRVDRLLDSHASGRIAEARDALIYNFGRAAAVAAGQIEEILRCQ